MNFNSILKKIASSSEPSFYPEYDPFDGLSLTIENGGKKLKELYSPSDKTEEMINSFADTAKAKNDWFTKNKDTMRSLGYSVGGGLTGALIGNLIRGDDSSMMLPIILGLVGSGGGYLAANPHLINQGINYLKSLS